MRIRSSGSSTSVILAVLILFYILLIAIIILFFQQIILNISSTQPVANMLAIGVLVILPLILLGMIIINVVKLFRERARKRPGARFKLRLILFFALIAFLSAIPQTTLSITFLNSLINSQFITQINDVFKSAWWITLEYYKGKENNLKTFGTSPFLAGYFQSLETNPRQVWEMIRTTNPEIQFFQVFNERAEELFFSGMPDARLNIFINPDLMPGMLSKVERGNLTLFRYLTIVPRSGVKYYVIFGIALPRGFDDEAKRLTDSKEIFEQLNRFKDMLQAGIILFYFFFSFPILLLSIIVSFFLAEEIIRPIFNLEEATRRVAQGDLSIRILARSGDELANLIESFNSMVSELDVSKKKLQKTEKIAAWQEIAQRLAHEIKNPLTPIKLAAERIKKKFASLGDNGENGLENVISNSVQAIIVEVDNLDKMLKEFNDFAKLPDPKKEKVYLKALVEEVVSMYHDLAVNVRIDTTDIDAAIALMIDRNQFKQVFANLIMNAFQSMPQAGNIFIRADLVKKGKTNYCRIQVRDTGIGIDQAIQTYIFNPYFTTKKGGTGLGLAIVERIVFDHNGNIWFETKQGMGTTFFIDLPMESE